jgi:hypothetical protein
MKTTKTITQFLTILFISIMSTAAVNAQAKFSAKTLAVKLEGTSTLHDWQMNAENQAHSEAVFTLSGDKVTGISNLNFVLPATSLKSDHKAMDKNTYKALKTDKNPTINFAMTSGTIAHAGGNNYNIKAIGKLTIAGSTRETEVYATGTYNPADKSFTINGTKKMKMTDFDVKPPTVMLGTIKTGNDITVTYNAKYTKI